MLLRCAATRRCCIALAAAPRAPYRQQQQRLLLLHPQVLVPTRALASNHGGAFSLDDFHAAPEPGHRQVVAVLQKLAGASRETSLAVVQRWQQSGVPLSLDTCKAAMQQMKSRCHSDLMAGMREWGLTPDLECYRTALGGCAREGQPQTAMDLLTDMKASGLQPVEQDYRCDS